MSRATNIILVILVTLLAASFFLYFVFPLVVYNIVNDSIENKVKPDAISKIDYDIISVGDNYRDVVAMIGSPISFQDKKEGGCAFYLMPKLKEAKMCFNDKNKLTSKKTISTES